jgi:hypothetical protein
MRFLSRPDAYSFTHTERQEELHVIGPCRKETARLNFPVTFIVNLRL